jgi:hypothetical protein
MAAMSERRPTLREWCELPVPGVIWTGATTLAASRWQRSAVIVISALEMAELPGAGGAVGPTWHASISRLGKRPKPRDVERCLRDFGLVGAEQDNHHPGGAKHFFQPVDPRYRGVCECKTTEQVITEPDGYQWTNPKDGSACRGCEFERLRGRPCPIHGRQRATP